MVAANGDGPVYTLTDYLAMLSDGVRVTAYTAAIRSLVRPGDRVIDLGSGFGYFAVVAASAGAAVVDAIDTNPVVHLGARVAAANGCANRICFHDVDISRFEPGARADVIVADLRGPTPFARRSLEGIIDARRRLLRPGGTIIGCRDVLYCAPSRAPAAFTRRIQTPLAGTTVLLDPIAAVAMATPFQCAIAPADLLVPGLTWGEVDYAAAETPHHRGSAEWRVERDMNMEGIAIWFEAQLGAGHVFSTEPGRGATTYSHLYLPLAAPLQLAAGDTLSLHLAVYLVSGDYTWAWTATVRPAAGGASRVLTQNSIAERVLDPTMFKAPAEDAGFLDKQPPFRT